MSNSPSVWGAFLHHPLRIHQENGGAVASVLERLPFDLDDLMRPGYRVAWRDAVVVWSRLRSACGEDGFADLMASHLRSFPLYAMLAKTLRRPSMTYRALVSLLTVVAPLELGRLELAGSTLHAELRLRAGAAPCRAWLEAVTAMLRALPSLYGRSEAVVCALVDEVSGVFTAELGQLDGRRGAPARDAAVGLLEALSSFDRGTRGAILAQIFDVLDEPERRSSALVLQERLALTRTQARVAARLADGRPVAEIADELSIAEVTVRTHLRNIFRKTGVGRQAELVALVHRTVAQGS